MGGILPFPFRVHRVLTSRDHRHESQRGRRHWVGGATARAKLLLLLRSFAELLSGVRTIGGVRSRALVQYSAERRYGYMAPFAYRPNNVSGNHMTPADRRKAHRRTASRCAQREPRLQRSVTSRLMAAGTSAKTKSGGPGRTATPLSASLRVAARRFGDCSARLERAK